MVALLSPGSVLLLGPVFFFMVDRAQKSVVFVLQCRFQKVHVHGVRILRG